MAQITQSIRQSLYRSFPQGYFLVDTVMHRASSQNWGAIIESIEVSDAERLDRAIRRVVLRADVSRALQENREYDDGLQDFYARYRQGHSFRLYGYKEVLAEMAPTTFVCVARGCGYVVALKQQIERGRLTPQDLKCPICRSGLKQIVHVFGHSRCGRVEEITPRKCPECREPMRLILDNQAFGRSQWRCPNRHEPKDLSMLCQDCLNAGVPPEVARMTPYAAGAAVKPTSLTKIDIPSDAEWEDVARERLQIRQESVRQLILAQYEGDPIASEAVKQRLNSSESVRRQMYEQFLASRPDLGARADALIAAIGGEPEFGIQTMLAEYKGVADQASSTQDPLSTFIRNSIFTKFHLSPRYISNLPIMEMIYGYQVGTSRASAKIRTFDKSGYESVVLAHRTETEAALFDLDPATLATWVGAKVGQSIDVLALQKMLIRPEADATSQEVYDSVEALLHTLSHLMIRQSELYTGLSRETLSELIFPPAMALAIYAADGSELGALRNCFASFRLREWLRAAHNASKICSLDPSCAERKLRDTAACINCLFIAERSCNGYWNEKLDRLLVSNVGGGDGFWDK
jgi:hypothetical protein